MYQILCNMKGSRTLQIEETHLATIEDFALFSELLDSNGLVDESVCHGYISWILESCSKSFSAVAAL